MLRDRYLTALTRLCNLGKWTAAASLHWVWIDHTWKLRYGR